MGYRQEILKDSPRGYWRLDETSGSTANDISGNSNNGTVVGSVTLNQTSLIAENNPSMKFGASGAYVDLSNPTSLTNFSTAWTLMAWVQPTADPRYCGFITTEFASGLITYEMGYDMTGAGGGTNSLTLGFYDGTWRECRDSVAYTQDVTYFAVGTWDGTTLRLYKNGAEVATNVPGVACPSSTNKRWIGRRHDAFNTTYFPGYVDEVAIFATQLSATRIQELYDIGKGTIDQRFAGFRQKARLTAAQSSRF